MIRKMDEQEQDKIDLDFAEEDTNIENIVTADNVVPVEPTEITNTEVEAEPEAEEASLLNTIGNVVEQTVDAAATAAATLVGADTEVGTNTNAATAAAPKTRKKPAADTTATTKTRKRRTKKERIHASAKTADDWIKYKILDPTIYGVSPEGDYYTDPLLKSGIRETTATIQPKVYYPASENQLKASYAERDSKVAEAEGTYSTARKELLEVMKSYHAGVALTSEVVLANMKVAEAEKVRNKYAYQTYDSYYMEPRPSLMSLDFDVRYVASAKKNPYNVVRFGIDRFPWQFHYSDSLEPVVPVAPVLAETKEEGAAAEAPRELSTAQIGAIIGKKRALTRPPMPRF